MWPRIHISTHFYKCVRVCERVSLIVVSTNEKTITAALLAFYFVVFFTPSAFYGCWKKHALYRDGWFKTGVAE